MRNPIKPTLHVGMRLFAGEFGLWGFGLKVATG